MMIRTGLVAFFILAVLVRAHADEANSQQTSDRPPIIYGAAWYPEQWPESRWDRDLTLMQQAGLNMVRIGEFAWSSLEPTEGQFTLDWMERAIEAAARHGMFVVIGTPTDAPPAWLTSKYPETLRVSEDGQRLQHGGRRHFSIGSQKYRQLCATIVERLAQRSGHNRHVIGWQIGNEYTEDSFDAESRAAFHRWLEQKYHLLDALNKQWVTAYWSQTYDQWDQIPMTTGRANPGLLLDYKRFVTDQWLGFQKNQLDVLRRTVSANQLITTNLGGLGWANRFDRQKIAADLDIISWDEYLGAGFSDNNKNGTGHLDPYRAGSTHDLVRGWKQKNFWVLEMAPGFVDWSPTISNSLDRGETRAMVWHAIGHGADGIAFWQWRSALNGQEQYHGSLVGADGEPLPVFEEVAKVGSELKRVAKDLEGTEPVSEVALLHDYESRWAIDFNRFSKAYDQLELLQSYYKAFREVTQSVDIVTPAMDLSRYKLILAPSLNVISADLAKRLEAYVRAGGNLVLGPRSGMKNEFNALNPQRQPGPLASALGGRVEQFYALLENVPVSGAWGRGHVSTWAERLTPQASDVEVLLRFGSGNSWLENEPAAIRRRLGKGTITYLGAILDPTLMASAAKELTGAARVSQATIIVPEGIDVCRRQNKEREIFVLLNFGKAEQHITLPSGMRDLLTATNVNSIDLKQYDVAVLSRPLIVGRAQNGYDN